MNLELISSTPAEQVTFRLFITLTMPLASIRIRYIGKHSHWCKEGKVVEGASVNDATYVEFNTGAQVLTCTGTLEGVNKAIGDISLLITLQNGLGFFVSSDGRVTKK